MKTPIRWILALLFFLMTGTTYGQSNYYSQKIKELVPKEYDSVIAYTANKPYGAPLTSTIDNLNHNSHENFAFIIGFKKNSCFAICFAQYDSGVAVSNRILIEPNIDIAILRRSWNKMENENFVPFIYKERHNKETRYYPIQFLHSFYSSLILKNKRTYIYKDIPQGSLSKSNSFREGNDMINLNYKHNASLDLFRIYTALTNLYKLYIKEFEYHK